MIRAATGTGLFLLRHRFSHPSRVLGGILNQGLWPQSDFSDSNWVNRVKVPSRSLSVQKAGVALLK